MLPRATPNAVKTAVTTTGMKDWLNEAVMEYAFQTRPTVGNSDDGSGDEAPQGPAPRPGSSSSHNTFVKTECLMCHRWRSSAAQLSQLWWCRRRRGRYRGPRQA